MSGIGARLKQIECRVILTDDQRRFERLKRANFNLYQVSDSALIESIVSILEGEKSPEWAEKEFQEPIPSESNKGQIVEAETWAHETLNDTSGPTVTETELGSQLNALVGYVQRSKLEGSEEYISRIRRLLGNGPTCRPSEL